MSTITGHYGTTSQTRIKPGIETAISHAKDAVQSAFLGEVGTRELWHILSAISELSHHHATIKNLAEVGRSLADRHNALITQQYEEMVEKLETLQGGSHA